jgi:SAM-dependent methyltransferase
VAARYDRRVSDGGERLRETFDTAAERYEAARPSYPEELIEDLVRLADLHPGDRLLEVGCGTGKATRPLAERGFSILCVEMGPHLAEQARRNLAGFPVEVRVAPFETWEGEPGSFDLVYAATAWHWIDPAVGYANSHALLRPGGHLAFWSARHAFPPGFDPFFTEIQAVYDAIGERRTIARTTVGTSPSWDGAWPPPPPERIPDDAAVVEASGLFEDVQVRRYLWETTYTAEEYLALLDTFSNHIAMEPSNRDHLYGEIRARVARRPDQRVRRHWYAILHVARRRAGAQQR